MKRSVVVTLGACALAGCAAERSPPVEGVAFATEDMVQFDRAADLAYVPARVVVVRGQAVTLAPEVIRNPDFETIPDNRGWLDGDFFSLD